MERHECLAGIEERGTDKVRENRLRRQAERKGLSVKKSRARNWSCDDYQGYMIVDPFTNFIVAGVRFDLTLDEVEAWLNDCEPGE